jgi:hypothetical protein
MKPNQHIDQLNEIRSMMERSSRFISLSGLSGVVAGLAAFIGVFAAYLYFGQLQNYYLRSEKIYESIGGAFTKDFLAFLFVDALVVLTVAIGFGIYFTTRQAKKKGQAVWSPISHRMIVSLAIPLITGGLFCFILLLNNYLKVILPCTLIFYGLGLVNASKYTLKDIHYLGITEIILGLAAAIYPRFGMFFWAVGFGIMHIIYGTIMYFKYERNVNQ